MSIKFDQLLEALALDESLSLTESKWDYELTNGPALRKAIKDENYFEVIKQLRKSWQELFDNDKIDDWDYERGIEDLEDLQYVDDENLEDELNYLLADFYDLCDNLRVWVPLLENLNEDLNSTNDELFYKAYYAYEGYMDSILADLGYTEDNCETLEDVPIEARKKAFQLWLKEMRERATWNDQMPTAVYDIIDLVDSSNLGESLNEATNSHKETEFQRLRKDFDNSIKIKDMEKESSKYRYIIDFLEKNNQSYSVYEHKTDNGCTIFYDGILELDS